jgi:hypothetical protein
VGRLIREAHVVERQDAALEVVGDAEQRLRRAPHDQVLDIALDVAAGRLLAEQPGGLAGSHDDVAVRVAGAQDVDIVPADGPRLVARRGQGNGGDGQRGQTVRLAKTVRLT